MILRFLKRNYETEGTLARHLLNAVWDEDVERTKRILEQGADANWIYNGYPILIHAVFTRNVDMVMLLLEEGATQAQEALGFALDRGIGEMVAPLAYLGTVPKMEEEASIFGPYPSRYAPLGVRYPVLLG